MAIYDAIKDVAKAAQKADNIELYQQILDLQAQALEEQEEKAGLRARVRELEEQLVQARRELEFAGSLEFDDKVNAYWIIEDGERAGLVCSNCWDANRKAIRLHHYGNGYSGCPQCEKSIDTPGSEGARRRAEWNKPPDPGRGR